MTPQEIAAAIGAPLENLLGTQDWRSDLHPELIVSELHYGTNGGCVCFRVANTATGETVSKLTEDAALFDPVKVEEIYSGMNAVHRKVGLEILPALYVAVPELDPENENIIRGLTKGGKPMIAFVVSGQLVFREPPGVPKFARGKSGEVLVDLSALTPSDKAAAEIVVAQIAGAVVATEVAFTDKG